MTREFTIDYGIGNNFKTFIASPAEPGPHPAVIVIHEIWGLNDNIRDICERFSREGFIALAPDLLSDTGLLEKIKPDLHLDLFDPSKRHEAQAQLRDLTQPIMQPAFFNDALAKLQAAVDYLESDPEANGKVGVVGFCFGGTASFFLAQHEPRLKACTVFYGRPPQALDDVLTINCPMMAFYGQRDQALISILPELNEAMNRHHKDFTYVVYPDTGHAFFNDRNPNAYNRSAADDAWIKTINFLSQHLG